MSIEELQSLRRQLETRKRNLLSLEEQAATYGIDVPLRLSNQIDHEKKEVARIEGQIAQLKVSRSSFAKVFEAAGAVKAIIKVVEAARVSGIKAKYHGCHTPGQDANLKLYIEEVDVGLVELEFIDSEKKTLGTISAELKAEQMPLAESWWGELVRLLTEAGYSPSDRSSIMRNSLEDTEPGDEEKSLIEQITDLLEQFGVWFSVLTLALAVFLSPIGWDNLAAAYAFLGATLVFALVALIAQSITHFLKVSLSCLIVAAAIGGGYFLWWASQPHFEITAFDTLDGDKNAYELTDHLIWSQNNLDEYGVNITFTLEIRPTYYGKQKFGRVIALISGDGGKPPLEKLLWDDFIKDSSTQQIQLTLPELLLASGLKTNGYPPSNPFRPGDLPFQQARLIVQIARAGAKTHPWDSEEITIRNAPWELRSGLVSRNGRREADVYVKNLGGAGEFTVRYRLVRIEKEIDTSPLPEVSGTTTITSWNEPSELVHLEQGEFFTDTVSVSNQLAQGRYLLEIYAVKKQNYVQFEDSNTTWEDLNSMNSPWWFGEYPTDKHLFVVTTSEFEENPTIQAEWERLRDEQDIDLGLAIGPVEEVTSATGTVGLRQMFQEGEIYVYNDQAYALYGPTLEHYRELGDIENKNMGFPISQIRTVTSSVGTTGTMIEFEDPGSPYPYSPPVIYASEKGVVATWGWIGQSYLEGNGGYRGWLGFPLSDELYFSDSTIQLFEQGYIVYHHPYVGEQRDRSRPPVAYPYLASRGTLFDVHAQQLWQDTGVQVQSGDRVTIIQVGGAWTHWGPGEETYDANGDANLGLQENTTLPSAITGALIGRIGEDDGHVFSVGRWSVLTSPVEGTLYLAMNDNTFEDNAGFITVQIMVEHSD